MKTGLPRGECAVEQRDESLLHNARIENCWWISGGYNPVEYQATVKCDLHFANGKPSADCQGALLFYRGGHATLKPEPRCLCPLLPRLSHRKSYSLRERSGR